MGFDRKHLLDVIKYFSSCFDGSFFEPEGFLLSGFKKSKISTLLSKDASSDINEISNLTNKNNTIDQTFLRITRQKFNIEKAMSFINAFKDKEEASLFKMPLEWHVYERAS
jgi:hypothetical protein